MRQTVLRHRYVLLILTISLLQCSTCTARPPRREGGPLITLSLPEDLQAQTRTNIRIYLQSANVMPGTRRFELSACIPLYQANGGIGAVSHEHFALPNQCPRFGPFIKLLRSTYSWLGDISPVYGVTYLSLVGRTIQGGGGGEGNLSHSKWKVGCSVKAYPSLGSA